MEAGLMDAAPIWTDLKSFPWAEFRDRVDILTGGYPCQPFSAAGKRLGTEDPRHLWPFIADGIRLLRPRLCFFENVEGHISLGLREVVGELEQIGYQAAWGIFSASEVGAPHQRKRVFILAYDQRQRVQELGWQIAVEPQQHSSGNDGGDRCGELADAESKRPREARGLQSFRSQDGTTGSGKIATAWPSRPGQPQHGWEPPRVVGDSSSERPYRGSEDRANQQPEMLGEGHEAMGNADHGRLASSLNAGSGTEADRGGQSDIEQADGGLGDAATSRRPQHQPRFNDPQNDSSATDQNEHGGQAEPPLGRDADGPAGGLDYAELCVTCDNRTDELRLLGNGVVPATAERAFRVLIEELITMEGQE